MNDLETRIRAATRAAAGTIPAGSAPPLRRPAGQGRRGRLFPRAAGSRRSRWQQAAVPLAAAAAVAVLAGSAFVLSWGTGSSPDVRSGTALPPLPVLDGAGLPAYFLGFPPSQPSAGNQPGTEAIGSGPIPASLRSHETMRIISTATGRVAATATLPGYVGAAAASDGAFFVTVINGPAASFYQIRMRGNDTGTTVTRLPVPAETAPIAYLAASPDGTELAYATMVKHGPRVDVQDLTVAATGTGRLRTWHTPPAAAGGTMGALRWLDGSRMLAFSWFGRSTASRSSAMLLLDTRAPGDDVTAGPAVLPLTSPASSRGVMVSGNGKVFIGSLLSPSPAVVSGQQVPPGSLVRFSAGRASVLYAPQPIPGADSPDGVNVGCNYPMWISRSGQEVLFTCWQRRPAGHHGKEADPVQVTLIRDGQIVRRLPWLSATARQETAFAGLTAYSWIPDL